MGRMGRYESNIMTWVRPSNFKLIDRAIRYTKLLLEQENQVVEYEKIAKALFKAIENKKENTSIVEQTKSMFN